jgi:hypothetical protein
MFPSINPTIPVNRPLIERSPYISFSGAIDVARVGQDLKNQSITVDQTETIKLGDPKFFGGMSVIFDVEGLGWREVLREKFAKCSIPETPESITRDFENSMLAASLRENALTDFLYSSAPRLREVIPEPNKLIISKDSVGNLFSANLMQDAGEGLNHANFNSFMVVGMINDLAELHNSGVIHGDIKRSSFCKYSRHHNDLRIIDFGNARLDGEEYERKLGLIGDQTGRFKLVAGKYDISKIKTTAYIADGVVI